SRKGLGDSERRHCVQALAIEGVQGAESGLAERHRLGEYGLEHWLQIAWGAVDGLQHFRRGGLSLKRFALLGEQPSILDGDNCLLGKVLQQRDLFFGEWSNLVAIDVDCPEKVSLLAKGNRQKRPNIAAVGNFSRNRLVTILGGILAVGNVY